MIHTNITLIGGDFPPLGPDGDEYGIATCQDGINVTNPGGGYSPGFYSFGGYSTNNDFCNLCFTVYYRWFNIFIGEVVSEAGGGTMCCDPTNPTADRLVIFGLYYTCFLDWVSFAKQANPWWVNRQRIVKVGKCTGGLPGFRGSPPSYSDFDNPDLIFDPLNPNDCNV